MPKISKVNIIQLEKLKVDADKAKLHLNESQKKIMKKSLIMAKEKFKSNKAQKKKFDLPKHLEFLVTSDQLTKRSAESQM